MLRIEGISKNYGDIRAVDDLSLSIEEGEIFVLLGPTGAGKTTTLKITAGLVAPDEGRIIIRDRDVSAVPSAFRNISFVFETYNLFPIYNVYDNIAFALRSKLLKIEGDEIDRRIRAISGDLHITHLLDRETKTLSGGETQRVALARALVRQASLNLFDEPLSNLDLKLREELRVEFKELHKKHRSTIFYVTHDHDSAVSIADRIGILSGGVLQQIDRPENLIENPKNLVVATLINYPAINIIDCACANGTLAADGKTPIFDISPADREKINTLGDPANLKLGLKPKDIRLSATGSKSVKFTGKVLHTEYQGYNKVVNLEIFGTTVRLITSEPMRKEFGDPLDIYISRESTFLFNGKNGERIL
jgi:multiple sugar transport system ATP-binding protein